MARPHPPGTRFLAWVLLALGTGRAAVSPDTCHAWSVVANSSGGLGAVCAACAGQPRAPASPAQAARERCVQLLNLPGAQLVPPFASGKTQYVARVPSVLVHPWLYVQTSTPAGQSTVGATCWDGTVSESPPPIAAEGVPAGGLRFPVPQLSDTGTVCEVVCAHPGQPPEFLTVLLTQTAAGSPQSSDPADGMEDEEGETAGAGTALGTSGVLFLLLLCACGACCLLAQRYGGDNPLKRGGQLLASIEGVGGSDSRVLGF